LGNSHALLAYFALSNADIVIARSLMDAQQAGLYAAGLIMTKVMLFLPQFVVVLAYPSMGVEASRRRTLLQSLAAVALMSAVVSALTSVLSGLAIVFVGGAQYSAIEESLWAFALLGGVLAMLQIVVYGVLARQARRSVYLMWAGLVTVAVLGCSSSSWAWTRSCSWCSC
jgi:O-antigen/teichoic acid export membrane protein